MGGQVFVYPEDMAQLLLAAEAKKPLQIYIQSHAHMLSEKFLAIIFVGDNPASAAYVRMKRRFGEKYNIETRIYGQDTNQTLESLQLLIHELNDDDSCAGVMIQLPLPPDLQPHALELCALIHPSKDVDGLGGQLLGLSTVGVHNLRPATPGGILTLLDHYGYGDVRGQTVVIIGQSNLLGKPLAIACINRGATIISANSDTTPEDLRTHCHQADIICSCTGVIHLIGEDHVRHDQSQIIIDAGYGHLDGIPTGDVDFGAVEPHVRAITPVPGGVGPMTVTQLFVNLLLLVRHESSTAEIRDSVAP